jgi:hypothetical protein
MEYKFLALSSNKTDRYEVVVFETEGQIELHAIARQQCFVSMPQH